jgi:L,D-peptidoglycan transpeptidase YkuD (ErfK/YbiS/YcfS/YnhG family)
VKLALLVALAACGRSEPAAVAPPVVTPASSIDAAFVPDAVAATKPTVIPASTRELVVAIVADWDAVPATLKRYRRESATTAWQQVGDAWPGVVGHAGTGWGAGIHGAGKPAGQDGPVKREGDGKSPAGAFALRGSYGYAKSAPSGTALPYTQVSEPWKCVDDPKSQHYDRILDRRTVTVDWKSAEDMRRPDELYTWTIDVAHNPQHVPGGGSCIFLHVWRGESSSTVGCTAMDETKLASLLSDLDREAVYVLLPAAQYKALATAWGLP